MKHLFIVNPVAGTQKPEDKLRLIHEAMNRLPTSMRARDEFEIYVTSAPMDAVTARSTSASTARSG